MRTCWFGLLAMLMVSGVVFVYRAHEVGCAVEVYKWHLSK